MGGGTKSPENLDRVVRFSTQGPFDTAVAGSTGAVSWPWSGELEDPEVLEELRLAHRTRGEAYRDGRVRRPESRSFIEVGEEELALCSGAACLVRKRFHYIPRVVGARFPVQLFGPPRIFAPPVTSIIGICADLCQLIAIPAWIQDPEGEFEDQAVPIPELLDAAEATALVSCRYATLAKARVSSSDFISSCLVATRQGYRYRWRGLLRWAAARRADDDEE